MKKYLGIFFFFLLSLPSLANHIIGGEIFYDYIGNDRYKITLKIYRDCNINVGFDGSGDPTSPAYITVFDASNAIKGVYDVGAPVITPVPAVFSNTCNLPPSGICIEEGLYIDTLVLPPLAGGYTIVYQRCCRTADIANLASSSIEGASYYTKIPGPEDAIHNSSPRFTKFPPSYICVQVPFSFDHAAFDPDGDELVYSFCAPYTGLDACCPSLGIQTTPVAGFGCNTPPLSCPGTASPPPYSSVQYATPFSGTYPILSSPAFAIDPTTGKITGTPNAIALYVVGICVKEYRNNKLINTHFRDFQFAVVPCNITALSLVADQKDKCQGSVISFTNQSIANSPSPTYHWDFGVAGLATDTSNLVNPSYTYPDTGTYRLTLVTNPHTPCSDTLRKPVYVYPPLDINYARPGLQCFKNNSFNFRSTGAYIPQNVYWLWDFTSTATPSFSVLKDPNGVHFLDSGLFFVKLKARQFSCVDSFIDSIRVVASAKARISVAQNNLCDPAMIQFVNSSTSHLPVRYSWKFSNGKTSADFAPTQLFTPDGDYTAMLIAETTELCMDTSVAVITNIHVKPKPLAAFSFTPHETTIFEPDITFKNTSPDWPLTVEFDFGDGYSSGSENPLHTYLNTGKYLITEKVVNSVGCESTLSDSIKVLPEFRFWIPNTFTPDNNARNDIFMPIVAGVKLYEFEVFNRWGQTIFSTTTVGDGWNGMYRGELSPQGIYTWKIKFTNLVTEKQEIRAGLFTLLRSDW